MWKITTEIVEKSQYKDEIAKEKPDIDIPATLINNTQYLDCRKGLKFILASYIYKSQFADYNHSYICTKNQTQQPSYAEVQECFSKNYKLCLFRFWVVLGVDIKPATANICWQATKIVSGNGAKDWSLPVRNWFEVWLRFTRVVSRCS